MAFREITPEEIRDNLFVTINKEWMLLTAGDEAAHNTMTVSWGSMGDLWGHYTATVHVRPQRYTLPFIENHDFFSLCVLPKENHDAMVICGRESGRDGDKDKKAGITPVFDEKAPYYREARLVLICRKLYRQPMQADCFTDPSLIPANYKNGDFHVTFVGAIEKVLVKDE